jgi:hypothetical protein
LKIQNKLKNRLPLMYSIQWFKLRYMKQTEKTYTNNFFQIIRYPVQVWKKLQHFLWGERHQDRHWIFFVLSREGWKAWYKVNKLCFNRLFFYYNKTEYAVRFSQLRCYKWIIWDQNL